MIEDILFSEDMPPLDWSDAASKKAIYGPKGALLASLPRPWTPPFALVPSIARSQRAECSHELILRDENLKSRARSLAQLGGLIVRSSVIGESIWDRGSYTSKIVVSSDKNFDTKFDHAVVQVLASAGGKPSGLVFQRYIEPKARGEFGNLARISKTRDQWELSTVAAHGDMLRSRFNTQRDEEASIDSPLEIKPGLSDRRLFGAVAAWMNNTLLRGRSQRLNCEWVTDNRCIYVVQIDEEDEDFYGVNPFQFRVVASHQPNAKQGHFLKHATGKALKTWDKLRVLDELWESQATHKPTLFYVTLSDLPRSDQPIEKQRLADDFHSLIGPDSIIVRTSATIGQKPPLLPRTESLCPDDAANWCLATRDDFEGRNEDLKGFAFVAHRFIASRASAWARAEPGNAMVEIHALWGLPDALQYCPYDIWEVHTHAEIATDYPEYKSNILIPLEHGAWEYVRVKNELARNLCIGRREAMDIAIRTSAIAERINQACHVMWLIGCVDKKGTQYSIPWYWTEAHKAEKNIDRYRYNVFLISDMSSLKKFQRYTGSRLRQAVELRPTDLKLMRDTKFIDAVGVAAKKANVPVILFGSTLAHAYYQLGRQNCTVVTAGEKEHSRVRRNMSFGKLVRDKIPERIAKRQEIEVTQQFPGELLKGFLTGKLLEEAMEVRSAEGTEQKTIELADLYEVFRSLVQAEGVSMEEIVAKAEEKKGKAGGFEKGLVLLQTGILSRERAAMHSADQQIAQVLARKTSSESYEIPFSFFGFMEFDQPRSLIFENFGVRLSVRLKGDRIELHLTREAEQLELPLDLIISPFNEIEPEDLSSKPKSRSKRRR
jgi:predicted house-cleaning noncanonical NTP pyrophosphatase (MazG superfamily)